MINAFDLEKKFIEYGTLTLPVPYSTMEDIVIGIETLRLNPTTVEEYAAALENILDKLRVTLNDLITHVVKHLRKFNRLYTDDIQEISETIKKTLDKWAEYLPNVEDLDDTTVFDDLIIDYALSKESYERILNITKKILTVSSNLKSDLQTPGTDILSPELKSIVDGLESIGISFEPDTTNSSGYTITLMDEYLDLTAERKSFKDLGYKKSDIKSFIGDLEEHSKIIESQVFAQQYKSILEVSDIVLHEIDEIHKSELTENSGRRLEELTIQLCRIYLCIEILYNTHIFYSWRPLSQAIYLLDTIDSKLSQ